MSGKQHIGKLSDSLEGDPDLEAARGAVASMRRLMKPTNRGGGPKHDIGDGDPCPEGHGRMLANAPKQTQYCPHRDHDGYPQSHPDPAKRGAKPSRKVWPLGHQSFAAAVGEWRRLRAPQGEAALPDLDLPELDIDLEV